MEIVLNKKKEFLRWCERSALLCILFTFLLQIQKYHLFYSFHLFLCLLIFVLLNFGVL